MFFQILSRTLIPKIITIFYKLIGSSNMAESKIRLYIHTLCLAIYLPFFALPCR